MLRVLVLHAVIASCTGNPLCSRDSPECSSDDADTSLLQAHVKTASGPKYFIQANGADKIPADRVEMDSGFVREILLKYPLDKNAFKIKGKTAFIPFGHFFESTFSRDANAMEQKDFGVEKSTAFVGLTSMISPKAKLAFAEKSHSLYLPGEVSTVTADRRAKMMRQQKPWDKMQANLGRDLRTTALAALSALIGPQVMSAGQDFNQLDAVRELTKANAGVPEASFEEARKRANEELKHRQSKTNRSTPIRSSIGCLHFENAEDMIWSDDGVEVPLDKKITAYRGRLASWPNLEYQMATGIATFHHDEETNSFDIHFTFSGVVSIYDTVNGMKADFAVSSPDGDKLPVPAEGRHPSTTLPAVAKTTHDAASAIPPSFSFLHSPRGKVGCPDHVLNELPELVTRVQKAVSPHIHGGEVDIFAVLPAMKDGTKAIQSEANCAVEYLKPYDSDSVVYYSYLEAVGLLHVLMEMPGETMKVGFTSGEPWNEITLM